MNIKAVFAVLLNCIGVFDRANDCRPAPIEKAAPLLVIAIVLLLAIKLLVAPENVNVKNEVVELLRSMVPAVVENAPLAVIAAYVPFKPEEALKVILLQFKVVGVPEIPEITIFLPPLLAIVVHPKVPAHTLRGSVVVAVEVTLSVPILAADGNVTPEEMYPTLTVAVPLITVAPAVRLFLKKAVEVPPTVRAAAVVVKLALQFTSALVNVTAALVLKASAKVKDTAGLDTVSVPVTSDFVPIVTVFPDAP